MSNIQTISAAGFCALQKATGDLCMIDVRTGAEHAACHVPGVKLLPLQEFDPAKTLAAAGKGQDPIYFLCKAGGRARQAAEKMSAITDRPLIVVEGGTDACAALGMTVSGERKIISLERQVRIAAGLLVVLGVALGTWVAPGFYGLAAFVGAGLTFAGITDTCAMGMLIARMPWNRA